MDISDLLERVERFQVRVEHSEEQAKRLDDSIEAADKCLAVCLTGEVPDRITVNGTPVDCRINKYFKAIAALAAYEEEDNE